MESFELSINGEIRHVACDPDMPLVYLLRNHLGLTGSKLGCGLEQCGACTVLVDGKSELSCVRAASEFVGREIVTVEALENDRVGSSVQRAFMSEGAAQCGYCTTGLVVEVTSLLARNPSPSREDIGEALHGHLCRCGSHARVVAAIQRASAELSHA